MAEKSGRYVSAPNTLFDGWKWQPPAAWLRVTTIDTHTGGEPLRIATGGLPEIKGRTMLEKRRYFMEHLDPLRRGLLREPRGHADMYGAILTRPSDDADLDVFFINTEGYSPMCGHAILAITEVALETGLVKKEGARAELVINVPPGRNQAGSAGHFAIEHPFEPDMSSLFGLIFTGPAHDPRHHSRNVTIFEDGEVDRSATGRASVPGWRCCARKRGSAWVSASRSKAFSAAR